MCNVCNNVNNLIHFFIDHNNTKQFWTSFYKWWNLISLKNYLFDYRGEEENENHNKRNIYFITTL